MTMSSASNELPTGDSTGLVENEEGLRVAKSAAATTTKPGVPADTQQSANGTADAMHGEASADVDSQEVEGEADAEGEEDDVDASGEVDEGVQTEQPHSVGSSGVDAVTSTEASEMAEKSDGPTTTLSAETQHDAANAPIDNADQDKEPAVPSVSAIAEPIPSTSTEADADAKRTQQSVGGDTAERSNKPPSQLPSQETNGQVFPQFANPSLPADVLDQRAVLRLRIEKDRRDGDAWLALIDDAMRRADLSDARQVYEDFLQIYPNAARQWQDYAALELQHSEFQRVEAIFTRCLRTTPSTDLWRLYLQYTRRVNPLPAVSKSTTGEDTERDRVRKVIEGAYEFALRFIGQSRDAGDVWRDYITLLKERETSNQWQAGQKMDDIRRAYQRAVAVPLANVEMIWREYDAYENGLNRITAKKFLADRSAAYMTARTAFREMRTLTDNLYRPVIARVPCWAIAPSLSPTVSPLTIVRDRHHIEAWKKYLRWEESNPLQLEDASVLQGRVLMAYRKAAMHLRFYPEIWYMAAQYLTHCERSEEAQSWLGQGMEACLGSSLLCFAFVEYAERLSQIQECGATFTAHLDWIHGEIDQLYANLEESIRVIDQGAEKLKAEAAARRRDEGASEYVEGEEREEVRKMDEIREQQREAERALARPKIEEMKENASLVWIKYMHFVRRTEGQRPMRAVFARARKSKHCTWQIFEANALMEYHCSKDVSVAAKVFELALKTYGDDEAFVVRYLDFLLSINDDNNARALFERTVTSFSAERARPLWDRWCDYEYSFGDSTSIARLTERLKEVYPDEPEVKRIVDRNSYMDLDVVGPRDLGLRVAGAGGSSAAERAVTASREMANDAAGLSMGGLSDSTYADTSPVQDVNGHNNHGNIGATLVGAAGGPSAKRARFADEVTSSAAQSTPPTGPAASRPIPTGPRGTKRSVSPPQRFVPPPREGPGAPQAHAGTPSTSAPTAPAPAQPAHIEMPDGILFFMDALPSAATFDGPRLNPDDILECLARSNVPAPDLAGKILQQQYGNTFQQGGGGFRGGRGGNAQRRGCELHPREDLQR